MRRKKYRVELRLGITRGRFCVHAGIPRNSRATNRVTEAALKHFYPVYRTVLILLGRRLLITQIILNLLLEI
jgi:hypothetical protein